LRRSETGYCPSTSPVPFPAVVTERMRDDMNEDPVKAEVQPEGEAAEPGFEASVKGIGQGIAGKFKEMVGELIDDPDLEQEGIVQQLDGQIRRAEADNPSSPEEGPKS
jgi:uncharacterized protein YjbJ (UPF0337 family)